MDYIWNLIYGAQEEEKPAPSGMKEMYTKDKDGFQMVKERDIFDQPYTSSSSSEDSSDDEDEWFEVNQDLVEKCEVEEKEKLGESGPIQNESTPEDTWTPPCCIS